MELSVYVLTLLLVLNLSRAYLLPDVGRIPPIKRLSTRMKQQQDDELGPSFLSISDGQENLAYRYTKGSSPAVLFCSGFQSTIEGNKALALESHCRRIGAGFCRFDYRGHGASSGSFDKCALSDWVDDASTILAQVLRSESRVIVVGSSMGGWIACHLALQHPGKVVGLMGIAAAPDFLQDILDSASTSKRKELEETGAIRLETGYDSTPYVISKNLLDDAQQWNISTKSSIAIQCPVHLFHGRQDQDISWQKSIRLMEQLESDDVVLTIIKDGDHRLSRPQDLGLMCRGLDSMLGKLDCTNERTEAHL